jgi:hypothetical protein
VLRLSTSEWQKDAVSAWRRHRQWPLVALVLVLLAFTTITGGEILSALLLVFLVALATSIALGPRDAVAHRLEPLVRRWPTSRRYLLGATLLLLLVCVLPAIGFFQVAYRVHTQAFVRHGQLRIALALDSRGRRIEQVYHDTIGFNKSALRARRLCDSLPVCALDLYQDVFFGTGTAPDTGGFAEDDRHHSEWLGLLRLPYDAENSVERRPLVHEVAADGTWRSVVEGDSAKLSYKPLSRDSRTYLSSVLPALTPNSPADMIALLIMFLGLPALTWVTAAFVSRRLFLLDLLDARPFGELTDGERTGRNLIVICRTDPELEDWGSAVDILDVNIESTGQNVRVFFPAVEPTDANGLLLQERRLVALERLVLSRHAVVVVLIRRVGSEAPLRDLLEIFDNPQRSLDERERLARLIERFIVIDAARTAGAADVQRPNSLTTTTTELARSALSTEEAGDPELRKLWSGIANDLADGSIHAESYGANPEMLDRLGERAESYYDSIWATCSRRERAVMVHLAEDGFSNSKDHEVLRRLLLRGLVRRTPRIALLNETFRRFVMHRGSAEEAIAERKRELSVWDGVRLPIMMLMLVVLTFFLVTQQQFFNTVTAVLAGVVTGLPAFVRLAGWISEKRQPT